MAMTGFICHDKYLEQTKKMSDAELGRLFRACMMYHKDGVEPDLDGRESMAFDFIKEDIDAAEKAHDEKCEKNRRNRLTAIDQKQDEQERTSTNDNDRQRSSTNDTNINKIKINKNKNKDKDKEIIDILFDRFWSAYPRHEAKATARAEFDKLKPDEELLETMLAAIDKQKQSAQWQENGGQYIPHPRTWLHQRRWEDEVTENRPAGKTVIAQQYSQRDYSGEDEAAMQWMIDAIKAEKEQENEGRLQVL